MSRGENSQARGRIARARIMTFLKEHGPSSAKVIGPAIGRALSSVYSHTQILAAAKKIHSVAQHTAGCPEQIFHLGPAPDVEPVDIDVPVTRPCVKTWAPHNFRDPLVAALFGGPASEQRA